MGPDEVILSRTDLRGVITECNDVFVDYAAYEARELLGAPHSVIRHPEMPRALFKLMWQEIQAGREVFVFVKNLAKDGRHYWVVAQVLPEIVRGEVVGYTSFRRCPSRRGVDLFEALYRRMLAEERRLGGDRGLEAGFQMLQEAIQAMGPDYEALVYEAPGA
jgi:PAS domain S-box-containing protein